MERLKKEFPGLTQSVFTPILDQTKGDVEAAIKMLRDPINEERDRSSDLREEQKLKIMKVVLGEGWATRDKEILTTLRQFHGDLDAAVSALYLQPALPPPPPPPSAPTAPQQRPQQPQQQQTQQASRPLGDKSLENAAKMEQMRIMEKQKLELEEFERQKQLQQQQQQQQQASKSPMNPTPTTPPIITMSKLPEAFKQEKAALEKKVAGLDAREKEHLAKEKALEAQLEHLAKLLQDADAKADVVRQEVQHAKEGHRDALEKDALARQKVMNAEKVRLTTQLEEARKQMEALTLEQRARLDAREAEAKRLTEELAKAEEEKKKLEGAITCIIEAKPAGTAGSVEVTWNINGLPLSEGDWIGLFIRNRQYSNKYTDYRKTEGKPNGKITFSGLKPGFYDARFFLEGKNDRDFRRSQPVLVGPEVILNATLEYSPQERRRSIRVTWVDTDKSVGASNSKDWVGLFVSGTFSNKKYLSCKYVEDTKPHEGLIFPCPHTCASFEFRYFRAESGYVSSSVPAVVKVPPQDSVTVEPLSIAPGNTLHVHWECHSVDPSSSDWVGIFFPSAPDTVYLRSAYCVPYPIDERVNGYHGGELSFDLGGAKPLAPGKYEVRFFSNSVSKYVHQPFLASFTVTSPTMSGH